MKTCCNSCYLYPGIKQIKSPNDIDKSKVTEAELILDLKYAVQLLWFDLKFKIKTNILTTVDT